MPTEKNLLCIQFCTSFSCFWDTEVITHTCVPRTPLSAPQSKKERENKNTLLLNQWSLQVAQPCTYRDYITCNLPMLHGECLLQNPVEFNPIYRSLLHEYKQTHSFLPLSPLVQTTEPSLEYRLAH